MNRLFACSIAVLGLVLAACQAMPAPPARTPESTVAPQTPTPSPASAQPPVAVGNVEVMLRGWLNAPDAGIKLVSAEPVEWPDACLGLPAQGEVCAQVGTPGYKITFEVNDGRYVIHTNDTADSAAFRFRVATAPAPMIGDGLVTWTGQNALEQGSCVIAAIGAAAIAISNCSDRPVQANFMRVQNVQALQTYAASFVSFKADTPAGKITFNGKGSVQPTPAEQRMIAEIASLMYQEASMGRSGASWGNAITLQREGTSPACVNVLATGEVNVWSCMPNDAGIVTRLNPSGLDRLYRWIDSFTPFEATVEEPDKITMQFSGRGSKEASEEDKQAIRTFTESLIGEVREANPAPNAVRIALPLVLPEGLDWAPAMSSASAVTFTARAEDPNNREFRWVEVRGSLEPFPPITEPGTSIELRGQTAQVHNFGEGHVVMWKEENTHYAVWSSLSQTETVAIAGSLVPMQYEMFNQIMRERAQQSGNAGASAIKTKVLQALNGRDYPTLQSVMADPFAISYWGSESVTLSPAKAIDELRTNLISPEATLAPPSTEASSSSIGFMVDLEPGVKLAGISVLKGFGSDGKGKAILIFARDSAGREFWHSMIYAMNGFAE